MEAQKWLIWPSSTDNHPRRRFAPIRHSAFGVPLGIPFDNGSLNLAADGRVQEYE